MSSSMDVHQALAVDAATADPAALRAALLAIKQHAARAETTTRLRCAELADGGSAAAAAAAAVVPTGEANSGAPAAPTGLMFSLEQLEAMLRRENELRLSAETQAAYRDAELREDTDWMEVTDGLQRRVVREAGVPPHLEEAALRHFRAAPHMLPQLKPLAIYHRFQRSGQGPYSEGDALLPGLKLVDMRCRPVSLNELAAGLLPVVLLAGSWGLVGAFNSLLAEFRGRADIRGVYITEAHAQDEWPISSARYTPDRQPVLLSQPQSTEERAAAAARFVEQYGFQAPMLVDPIDNPFDAAFAPWPLRFYILHRSRLRYKAQPRDCSYDLSELRDRLMALLAEEQAADCGSNSGGSGFEETGGQPWGT
ncbi:hypothetical protein ABPG75_003385 [Micractinium tetrahymenae]